MEGKFLITTDNWFYAPDGKMYRSVWGQVEILEDTFLGVKTNSRSSNWFAKIGAEDNFVIVAGCQIHYACKSDNKPHIGIVEDYLIEGNEVKTKIRSGDIYIAE